MLGQMFLSPKDKIKKIQILGDIAKRRRDACRRREGEYVCEHSPIWRQQRDPRRRSSIIGISSRA